MMSCPGEAILKSKETDLFSFFLFFFNIFGFESLSIILRFFVYQKIILRFFTIEFIGIVNVKAVQA